MRYQALQAQHNDYENNEYLEKVKYLDDLTRREWELILLISIDYSNTMIADQLCISTMSVKTYRSRIASKLLLHGRDKLSRFARMNKESLTQLYNCYYCT